ncbi:tetratricopeptide repeat protein [Virgibacillus sp. NKC19-3]|uniref:tetratricopeptide repeat protein n=1 Tax=Virgibacillus saliphilus TaxID=2831674 RepID=UPI001C9A4150|nr:hypothetical protein [Virgibacillus sp. NKC19-3]MBY7143099.1 tetratricopeptide repeat protein [Virgibacillus sp. NKC19-3]
MQYKQGTQIGLDEELKALITEVNIHAGHQDTEQVMVSINKIEDKLKLINESQMNTSTTFKSLITLATYYKNKSNYGAAAHNFRKALNLVGKLNEEDGAHIIDAYLKHAALEREYAQEKKARMILAKLLYWLDKKRPEDETAYGLVYSHLGKLFLDEEDIASGIDHMKKALAYFSKNLPENHPLRIETIHAISKAYIKMEDYDNALALYQNQLKNVNQEKDKETYGKTMLNIGEVYYYIDLRKAHNTILEAKNIFLSLDDTAEELLMKAYLMLGELEESIKNDMQAIHYYDSALQVMKNQSQAVLTYVKLGMLSLRSKQFDQAKKYLEKGLPLSVHLPRIRAQFLLYLGKAHSQEQAFAKANSLYTKLLKLLEQQGHKTSKNYGNTLQAIAANFSKQEKWKQALPYYDEALSIYKQLSITGKDVEIGTTYIHLAFCQEKLAESSKEGIEKCYDKGYEMMKTTNDVRLKEEALSMIIEFYTRQGQLAKKEDYENELAKIQSLV